MTIKFPRLVNILSWLTLTASGAMLLPLPHYLKMLLWGSAVLLFFLTRYRSRAGVIVTVWLILSFVVPVPIPGFLPDLLRFTMAIAFWGIILAIGLLLIKRRLPKVRTIIP